jgi:hypothetical protein
MIMSDRLGATSSRSKTIIGAYGLVAPWQTPHRSVFKMLQYGYKLGMRMGEVMPQSNMHVPKIRSLIFSDVHRR